MEEPQKYDFTKLKNLESIKEFCNSRLFEIATGGLRMENHSIKVRFIDFDGNFGFTGLGRFFFYDDCMYILSNDKKYEIDHNPDIADFREDFEILKITNEYIVRVLFAGVFTGFYDDKGERIFTGDVVNARVLDNPRITSNGGVKRARNENIEEKGGSCEAGVNEIFGIYSFILDNLSLPLSWATELEIVGSLFYDLEKGETEVDIRSLCNSFAQSRIDRNELKRLIKKSPFFPPVTWQEKAIELLCGNNNENDNEMNNCNYENFIKYLKDNGEINPWEYVADLAEKSGHYYDSSMDYVCEDDKTTIEMYNLAESRKPEHKFITNIMPVPFEGNIFEAKIIILTLNPGFVEEVNYTLYNLLNADAQKQITDYHIQNLRLQCKGIIPNEAVKFIGDRYWYNKTRKFREENKFELSEFAIIQYIGYQSKEFNINKELKQLKSIDFTRQLLKYIIDTRIDDFCLVIARNYTFWTQLLEELDRENKLNNKIVKLINYRNTTLSMDNIRDESKPIISEIINKRK